VSVEWAVHLHGDFGAHPDGHLLPCADEEAARSQLSTWRWWRGRDVYSVLMCRVAGFGWAEVQ
jgi:hypothetical protein